MSAREAQWIASAETAADQAVAVHDDATAVQLLADVVSGASLSPQDLGRLTIKLGRAAMRRLVVQQTVIDTLSRALAGGGMPEAVRGEVRSLLGVLLVTAGDGAAGHREWKRSVEELRGQPELAISTMTRLAYPWVPEGKCDDHVLWLQRALHAAQACGDSDVRLNVALTRAGTLLAIGDPEGWAAVRAIPAAVQTPEARRMLVWARFELATTCFHLGRFARAREFLDVATNAAVELEQRAPLESVPMLDMMLRWATGVWEDLEAEAERLIDAYVANPLWSLSAMLAVASLATARGDVEKAEQGFADSLQASESCSPAAHAMAAGGLARIRLARGRIGDALQAAAHGVAVVEAKGIWAWAHYVAPDAVETMLAAGRPTDATRFVDSFEQGLRGRDAPWSHAALTYCQGVLQEAAARHAQAATEFAEADERYAALPMPYEAGRARERSALCRLASGEPSGEAQLRDALSAFIALGATADEHRVQRRLRSHGFAVPRPGAEAATTHDRDSRSPS